MKQTQSRITFVLPGPSPIPVGGTRVVYEYARGLARRGHMVHVVHPATPWRQLSGPRWLASRVRYWRRLVDRSYLPTRWFADERLFGSSWCPSLHPRNVPDGDVIIATAWQTAEWVATYGDEKGRKYYLIQHLERWSGSREAVLGTWTLPLHKIAIARWLQDCIESLGESAVYIPNGLDFGDFGVDVRPDARDPLRALMLAHHLPWKGTMDGIQALTVVRAMYPRLRVTLFGTGRRPRYLPRWMEYVRNPPQKLLRALYNESAIFVAPSHEEGWGLPPAEAMACGAAVVATDNGGHREYAVDGKTALLSPVAAPEELAQNIIRLIDDPALRLRLSESGSRSIRRFTWGRAVAQLASVIDC